MSTPGPVHEIRCFTKAVTKICFSTLIAFSNQPRHETLICKQPAAGVDFQAGPVIIPPRLASQNFQGKTERVNPAMTGCILGPAVLLEFSLTVILLFARFRRQHSKPAHYLAAAWVDR